MVFIVRCKSLSTKNLNWLEDIIYTEHNYEKLYDVEKDPHETTNLVNNPKYKQVLFALKMRYKELKEKAQ